MQFLGSSVVAAEPGFTRWSLDPTDVVQRIEFMLQGATFQQDPADPDRIIAVVPSDPEKQLLNERGRKMVLSLLSAFTHKLIALSNLSSEKIALHVRALHKKLNTELLRNWRLAGVRNPLEVPKISYMIAMNIEAAMRRALPGEGGGTWKGVTSVHQVIEQKKEKPSGGGGLFSLPFKRGGE